MPHSRSRRKKARRSPKAHPRGVLELTAAGYGFVQTAEGEFFIPAAKTADAFDGDFVEVSRLSSKGRNERMRSISRDRPAARVVRVISRAHATVVGRYEVAEPFGVVVPEDPCIKHDIFTLRREAPHVQDGDIVRVRMTVYPSRTQPAQGVIEEILGHEGDAGVDVELVISRHKLETHFSDAALDEVKDARVDAQGALESGRYRDLTDHIIFTIDPDDAHDFDDALSLECVVLPDGKSLAKSDFSDIESSAARAFNIASLQKSATIPFEDTEGRAARKALACGKALWRLGVHIADVSHYVPWGSAVDLNARRRATSVYLVDRVIPMLPEKLSHEACSLRPHERRRTISVDLYMDNQAQVLFSDIYPSVITSCARLTYAQVKEALDAWRDTDIQTAAKGIAEVTNQHASSVLLRLSALSEIAQKLHDGRIGRGGIDFKSEEAKVRLDAQGHPVSVDVRVKNEATSLVEEAMIAANEAVARYLHDCGTASIYRVHDAPSPSDLADIQPILQEFGYDRRVSLSAFKSGNPFAIQKVLKEAQGRREEFLVSSLIVRAMKRAVYRDECIDHYALASKAYTHFTSPIRRYPDLMVHRMLKCTLFGRSGETSAQEAMLAQIAEHSSKAERIAETAARESQELKLYELLEQRIGEEVSGIVSGVLSAGFFVRLSDTSEGFVSLRGSKTYWILDASRRTLTDADSGELIRLGMKARVRIKEVCPLERRAEFALIGIDSIPAR